jgi:hypothetical protein
VHDAVQCEEEGVPATVVVTEVFPSIAEGTAVTLGVPGYHYAVIPHPIWTRDEAWMTGTADAIADLVASQLSTYPTQG